MAEQGGANAALLPLLRELGDLKRIGVSGQMSSIATGLFANGWSALAAGMNPTEVMYRTVAAAMAAARLGSLDRARLDALGLTDDEALRTLKGAVDEVAGAVDPTIIDMLSPALADGAPPVIDPPAFVAALAMQPRAGITCPGRARIILQPAENHAEHCLMVGVYGVLMSSGYGAEPTSVFVASMAHHFHNATMPDSGFSGEMLLGAALDRVIERARERCLAQLNSDVAGIVRTALEPIASDTTPEARAFHAADVLDRVLEIEQHLTRAAVTMPQVMETYGLVHEGPVKPFHDRVLAQMSLV